MKKKYCLTLDEEFLEFVTLNEIEDPKEFLINCYKKGFQIEKYGEKPQINISNNEIDKDIQQLKNEIKQLKVQKIVETPNLLEKMNNTPTPTPIQKTEQLKKTLTIKKEDLYDE